EDLVAPLFQRFECGCDRLARIAAQRCQFAYVGGGYHELAPLQVVLERGWNSPGCSSWCNLWPSAKGGTPRAIQFGRQIEGQFPKMPVLPMADAPLQTPGATHDAGRTTATILRYGATRQPVPGRRASGPGRLGFRVCR